MSNRFQELCRLPVNLYAGGSPVIIEAGALLKDTTTGKVLAQLKIRNLSEKKLTACKVAVRAFEASGAELEGVPAFSYLDIQAGLGEYFGSKMPVAMPDSTTRKISASVTEAVFEDGAVWSAVGEDWQPLPAQETLADRFADVELQKQYRLEIGEGAAFVPTLYNGLFLCTCGTANLANAGICHNCHRDYQAQMDAMNLESLTAKKEARLQKEAEERAAAEKAAAEAAEKAAAAAKKTKKVLSIALPAAAVLIAALLLTTKVFIPNSHYNAAAALMSEGKYEEAIVAFEAMEGYKDSKDLATECAYSKAVSLKDAGKYDGAIAAFEALNGYKDSVVQIENCQTAIKDNAYNAATKLMTEGKFIEAVAAFEAMNGYKDSAAQATECAFCAAVALKDAGKYDEAIKAFEALGEYKDSKLQIRQMFSSNGYLGQATVGSTILFGAYEQDNNTANGQEPIEWRVLAKENGKLLVISEYGLDAVEYNTKGENITWAQCTLHSWLNGTFLKKAFSAEEQAMIATTNVTADKNPEYNTNPGNATNDKVFLLSIPEAEKYFTSDRERQAAPTAYAIARGAWTSSDYKTASGAAACWWWLRSPGRNQLHAAPVDMYGSLYYLGDYVLNDYGCVRPALWINLES